MPRSKRTSSRADLTLAIAVGMALAWLFVGESGAFADDVPRIAQSPQSPTPLGVPRTGGYPDSPPAAPAPPESPATSPSGAAISPSSEATNAIGGAFEPGFGGTQSAALGGSGASMAYNQSVGGLGGYIDSAVPRSNIRLRYDDAYNMNRPDRAEYFYPQCGCFFFGNNTPIFSSVGQRNAARRAFGPPLPESKINNVQEYSTYIEYAPLPHLSGFVEVPVRYIDPQVNRNAVGFGDMNLGFKYAFIAQPDSFWTFQFKTYVPTGAGELGLGTNHPSLEPGILAFQRLSDRLYFVGEFKDWIPIHGTNSVAFPDKLFSGNILNYGLGTFYNMVLTDNFRAAPTAEFVGWTVLGGLKTTEAGAQSASGDTIVNMKIGVRFGLGNYNRAGGGSQLNDRLSFYAGYARALTGDFWYKDMLRLEMNWYF